MKLSLDFGVVFPVLVAGRLLVALTNISDALKHDHQLSTPLTSYLNLQEGIYLFKNGIDPYSGGVFRHSPLFLALFTTVLPTSRTVSSIIWTLCDAVGAWALVQIWRARQRVAQTSRDGLIAAIYLLNPYIFMPTLSLSTSPFENTLALLSFMFATQGLVSPSLLAAALLLQLSLSSILLLAPLIMLLASSPVSQLASPRAFSGNGKMVPLVAEFTAYTTVLTLASTVVSGGWAWVPQTWGASLTLPDLTPNCGLWWYFFTEMFDYFRPFFLMVFSIHLLIYIVPVCIKFQYDPLYAGFILLGILSTFKSYPTMADQGLFLSMIAVFPEIYPYLRYPIVTTLLHLHASLLMPLFHHLWLNQGTANANFFYASTLVFACANGAALTDCIWAGLRIAIGEPQEGFVVVQE
ncbi:GPI transamidase subunit PIG-U [Mycena sanguinolenta]|nr:GPI transamidase subunit PIG-U [Mycena sanguinolenta]